jgi:hypothetical protein
MLRIQPVGYAPPYIPPYAPATDWGDCLQAAQAPWQFNPRYELVESYNALVDEDYFWLSGDKPPVQNLSSALTIENALLQRNLLLQCGVGYEHVGMLVIYGQYSGKGASLQAVMPAVWASAEYAKLADKKRELMGLSDYL